jgi:sulfur-oxidizing protein SoxY
MQRRRLFKLMLGLGMAIGLTKVSRQSIASERNDRFVTGDFQYHFDNVMSHQTLIDSPDIQLSLPSIAENGAVVPLTISSELEGIDQLMVWVEKNPTPLAASFEISPNVALYITARIKMAKSCPVIVVARQGDRWLRCQQWVQVMQGGCGTG